jgi:hypothetical protein
LKRIKISINENGMKEQINRMQTKIKK